ncbi:hypothetical protein HBB16_06725 [Pseudonocardia sp. MCCB 268]|nr:hypothetical protein [Pseudonocardia cytotoxica]
MVISCGRDDPPRRSARTRSEFIDFAYTRRPGFETRRRPAMLAFTLQPYFSSTTRGLADLGVLGVIGRRCSPHTGISRWRPSAEWGITARS